MKHKFYIIIAALLSVFALSSCRKEESKKTIVDGEWHMVVAEGATEDVYLSFCEGVFIIYQKTGDLERHYTFNGTYTVQSGVLSGVYSDGTPFGSEYEAKVSGGKLTLKALNGSEETVTYKKEAVPAEVKANAVPHVKAAVHIVIPVL